MSATREKQSKFAHMVALLILHCEAIGYEVTFGDCYRDDRCDYGHPASLHRQRMAVDINLFLDGEYITNDIHHEVVHKYWESIGGSPMILGDGNHYSVRHDGMR